MNFKDPFADDLKHFKATTSTLGSGAARGGVGSSSLNADLMFGGDRSSHRQMAAMGGSGMAGLTGLTPTPARTQASQQSQPPPQTSPGAMPASEVPFWGAPQQTFAMGSGGGSNSPSAAATGLGLSFPGAGGMGGGGAVGRRGGPAGGAAAAAAATGGGGGLGGASGVGRRSGGAVSWLSVGSDPPRRADTANAASGAGMGRPTTTAVSQNQPSRASDDFLSFLDPSPAPVVAAGAAAASATPPQQMPFAGGGTGSASAPVMQEDPALAAQRAEQARQEKELHDLYVAVGALEQEERALTTRLETKTIEEEAAVTALQTTIIEKTTELEEKQKEKDTKMKEIQISRARREAELDERHTREMAALQEELKAAERSRYEKQLQKLQEEYDATAKHVTELRAQRALLIQQAPFSERGVALQLSTLIEEKRRSETDTASGSDGNNSSVHTTQNKEKYEDDFESASSAAGEGEGEEPSAASAAATTAVPSSQKVEDALEAGAALLKAYCDTRLGRTRDGVVGYIHDETLSVAHEVRLRQLQGYNEEASHRKAKAAAFAQQRMEAHIAFCRERAARKQTRVAALHDGMEKGAALFREQAKRRLEGLLAKVSSKLEAVSAVYEAQARENNALLQRKAAATREGDAAMAAAQCAEVRHRCQTERAVRQRLLQSQRESLQDQLTRIRHQGDTTNQEKVAALYTHASTSSAAVATLREQLVVLQGRIEKELREAGRRVAAGSGPGAPRAQAERRMDLEEAEHAVHTLLQEAQRLQEELRLSRQRQEGALAALVGYLDEDLVGASVARRLALRRDQARLDHLRVAWEREHLQQLCSPHALEVLAAGTDGPRAVTELQVRTDPQGAATTALLELLAEQVRARDAGQQALRQRREGQRAQYADDVAALQAKYAALLRDWAELANAAKRLDEGREGMLTARTQVAAAAAEREAQLQVVETERARLARQRTQQQEARARLEEEATRAKASHQRQRAHLRQLLDGHRPTLAAATAAPAAAATTTPPTTAAAAAAAAATNTAAAAAMGSLSPLTVATPSSGKGAAVSTTTPMTSPPPPGGARARTRSPLRAAGRGPRQQPYHNDNHNDEDEEGEDEDDVAYDDYRDSSGVSVLRTPTPFTELLSMLDSSSGSVRTSV